MPNTNLFDRAALWAKHSIMLKLLTMGFLLLVLLIPTGMISSTIAERERTQSFAISDITSKWGGAQSLGGPWLSIPYLKIRKNEKGVTEYYQETATFLPETLNIKGDVTTEKRHRGIYEAVLYTTVLTIDGQFPAPSFKELGTVPENILWDQATISYGITDMNGIRAAINVNWNGKTRALNPGLGQNSIFNSGVSGHVAVSPSQPSTFSFQLELNGSQMLYFYPFGKTTQVHLTSKWPAPGFNGRFLPVERTVTPQGFDATWKVLHLNRNYAQSWLGAAPAVDESSFGVQLLIPVDQYLKTARSVKYAVLFVLLTFGAIFFIEIINGKILHPLQYFLVGLALIMFYSLLLSLAEHIGFMAAYVSASAVIITMIGLFAKGVFQNPKTTGVIFGLMTALYLYLYSILQLEDYALLIGNMGLLLALGVAMYLCRRMDWVKTPS